MNLLSAYCFARLLVALSVGVNSCPLSFSASVTADLKRAGTDLSFNEQAVTAALTFVRHVLNPSGYAVRRLVAGHRWAWADDGPGRLQVWEFEPPAPRDLSAPLRMDDAQQHSGGDTLPSPAPREVMKATTLLENLRQTAMVRGGLREHQRKLRGTILTAIEGQGVPRRLAARIAFQLVLKFPATELGQWGVWQALGQIVKDETGQLKTRLGLTDRQIITALPKLSAECVEKLFEEMRELDAKFGRTIAQAALDGADPLETGRRYGRAFREAIERLKAIDPRLARTLAGAALKARHSLGKSLRYLQRFQKLVENFKGDYPFVRTMAKVAFRAADPIQTARQFVMDYRAIVADFVAKGLEPDIARTLAGTAALGADPLQTAYKLVDNFSSVLEFAKLTHASVARSVALAACRATDPRAAAMLYLENYDRIVEFVNQTDPQLAHEVAVQAFRTNDPLAWAQRYLKQLKAERRRAPRSLLIGFIIAALASNTHSERPAGLLATAS